MRGVGLNRIITEDEALQHGFLCAAAGRAEFRKHILETLADLYTIYLPYSPMPKYYDKYLDEWRASLWNEHDGGSPDEDQLIEEINYSLDYIMHGEPRAHGVLDSGLL